MGGLKIWLVLCLGYLVTTQHHRNEANKKKTFETNFEGLGKFRKAAIGTSLKIKPKEWSSKKVHHPPSVNLVKEFAEFKQKSNVLRKPEVPKEQGKRSKDDSLEKIDQLENLIVTKGKSRDQSTTTTTTTVEDTTSSKFTESKVEEDGTSYKTSETTDGSEPETPKTLSLTSDSHQKRGPLDDLNQDDGTFVVAVVGVALCCIIAVVGVGFVLHRPVSCPGSSSPFSDSSPTFHSAKLAFSSRSPEDKISNSKLSKADTRNLKRKSAEEPEKSSSRAFKFRENTDNNNQGQMYNYKGNLRQESLIDIDGPEEDEDFIYECPGLAPHGEMEVTNPFFLQKDFNMNMDHLPGAGDKGVEVEPCPINTDNTIRHGNIVRNIKPGLQ